MALDALATDGAAALADADDEVEPVAASLAVDAIARRGFTTSTGAELDDDAAAELAIVTLAECDSIGVAAEPAP